jgi:hypothetical protein
MNKIYRKLATLGFMVISAVALHAGDAKDLKNMAPAPVMADSDKGFYVAAYGGADFTDIGNNSKYQIGNVGPSNFFASGVYQGNGKTVNSVGGVGGIKFGYKFEGYEIGSGWSLQPVVELEAAYIGNTGTNTFSYAAGETINVKSEYDNVAILVNGLVRFKNPSSFTPYLGFGLGAEYYNPNTLSISDNYGVNYTGKSESIWVPAGQALVGVDYKVANHWTLFTEFKFIIMDKPHESTYDFDHEAGGPSYSYNPGFIGENIGVFGLKYGF